MKRRSISNPMEAGELESSLVKSAYRAIQEICNLHKSSDVLQTLWLMKFQSIGFDPLDSERSLNIIEQINQTFTYIASARAVKLLFEIHPELAPFTLNLGNLSGTDIESKNGGGLACEVFAAVNTSNNKKLVKDIEKVSKTTAFHKYVFLCAQALKQAGK